MTATRLLSLTDAWFDPAGGGAEPAPAPMPETACSEEGTRAPPAAGGSPAPTARIIPMPKADAPRQELRIEIRVPLAGDVLDQAPTLAAVKEALDEFRAALDGAVEAAITHEIVTPRPRKPRAAKVAA